MKQDLTGRTFGRLTVLKWHHKDAHYSAYWLCACACWREKVIKGAHLLRGRVVSCGCYHAEVSAGLAGKHLVKHGHAFKGKVSREWNTWASMFQRCYNTKNHKYPRYGGRGITVCTRWEVFKNFLEDMGTRPAGKTLDRKDNAGNYEPGNCRWATPKEQRANQG